MIGLKSSSSLPAVRRSRTATSSSMKPSESISSAIRHSASDVRLPTLVCSIHNLPSSIVNSVSHMSL